ncbi:hypothetical protein TBR22_A11590 [Luteitalea sp. TBR-22]|uniref:metal-sensitive transcriptional regulator n=1 Tax=Luteitalea sp. TBR-22 TaxID=2802971 RepID=UPI001AF7B8E9|nr:metal-sensitive transcriptional regulator [Luteitalea sp. TBR-22]BCS31955.1 hypothetical protein TBR22_A11590 [Luteitalea sp. TBR-22]
MESSSSSSPDARARMLARLRRIEGQVRGLQRMIEEERPCAEVLTQVASAQEALRAVGREVLRQHLRRCAERSAQGADARAYDELVDLMYRHIR